MHHSPVHPSLGALNGVHIYRLKLTLILLNFSYKLDRSKSLFIGGESSRRSASYFSSFSFGVGERVGVGWGKVVGTLRFGDS